MANKRPNIGPVVRMPSKFHIQLLYMIARIGVIRQLLSSAIMLCRRKAINAVRRQGWQGDTSEWTVKVVR